MFFSLSPGTIQQPLTDWCYAYDSPIFVGARQSIFDKPYAPLPTDATNGMPGMHFPVASLNNMAAGNHSQMSFPSQPHHHLHGAQLFQTSVDEEKSHPMHKTNALPSGLSSADSNDAIYQTNQHLGRGEPGSNYNPKSALLGHGQHATSMPGHLPQVPVSLSSVSAPALAYPLGLPFSVTAPIQGPTASVVQNSSSSVPPSVSADRLFDSLVPGSHLWTFGAGDSYMYSTVASTSSSSPSATTETTSKQKNSSVVKKKKRNTTEDSCGNTHSNGKKKRLRHPDKWKKNVNKRAKLCGEEHLSRTGHMIPAKKVEYADCSQCSFKCCQNFSEDLRQQIFDVFYSLGSNESQKQFVCQNVIETPTKVTDQVGDKTSDVKKEEEVKTNGEVNVKANQQIQNENKRKVTRKYFLPDSDNTKKQVCVKFFCRTLAIGTTFISHALKHKQFGCYMGKEKRGKPHNKIPQHVLEPAHKHIQTVLCFSDSPGIGNGNSNKKARSRKKKFFEQGLNVTKMYEIYKQDCQDRGIAAVSISMYRTVFHSYS